MRPAKIAELIEMPLGMWTGMGPRNRVLDGVQIPLRMTNIKGKGAACCEV